MIHETKYLKGSSLDLDLQWFWVKRNCQTRKLLLGYQFKPVLC